jgi:anti-sigma factor RsiW
VEREEAMKVEWVGQHPEEGSIHAWLDGELDPSEAARLDEHVRGCEDCAARVAEARGLMAGASRVVGQLDMTPGRLIQPAATPTLDDSGSMWRLLRVTPTRAAIAAVLLVALGISLTRTRVARESEVVPAVATTPVSSEPMTAMGAPKEAPAPMKDGLLDSAISRRLADEHPARTVERAPGAAIPSPEGPTIAAAVPDTTAPQRVAAARASIRSSRDSASPPADRARVGFNSGAVVNADRLATAGQAAEAAGVRNELSARVAGVVVSAPTAAQCFLVESGAPGAQWGSVTLPMVLAFDSSGTLARVLTPGGSDTEMRAVRTAVGPDSLTLRMRRIGYSGTLALSGSGEARTGVMRSAQATAQLSEVVTTSVGEARRTSPRVDTRVPQPAAAPPAVAKTVEAPARDRNAAVGAQAQGAAGAAVAITAHVVSCTTKR